MPGIAIEVASMRVFRATLRIQALAAAAAIGSRAGGVIGRSAPRVKMSGSPRPGHPELQDDLTLRWR
jgi:hypothetical protein